MNVKYYLIEYLKAYFKIKIIRVTGIISRSNFVGSPNGRSKTFLLSSHEAYTNNQSSCFFFIHFLYQSYIEFWLWMQFHYTYLNSIFPPNNEIIHCYSWTLFQANKIIEMGRVSFTSAMASPQTGGGLQRTTLAQMRTHYPHGGQCNDETN